jgi:hypothetical protein
MAAGPHLRRSAKTRPNSRSSLIFPGWMKKRTKRF